MQKPMDTEELIDGANGLPELAAEIYAASLMAIEVDTMAEKAYLENLTSSLGTLNQCHPNIFRGLNFPASIF
jgi:uncharacterized membrane protein YebE (DUF533 family)